MLQRKGCSGRGRRRVIGMPVVRTFCRQQQQLRRRGRPLTALLYFCRRELAAASLQRGRGLASTGQKGREWEEQDDEGNGSSRQQCQAEETSQRDGSTREQERRRRVQARISCARQWRWLQRCAAGVGSCASSASWALEQTQFEKRCYGRRKQRLQRRRRW
jgi:hypothetical protein